VNGQEKFPRLQALRHAFVKLEMIHQAGGVGTGSLRSDWASGKSKSKFTDARLRKSRRPLQNQKQQHKQRQSSRPDVGATERNVNGTELELAATESKSGAGNIFAAVQEEVPGMCATADLLTWRRRCCFIIRCDRGECL
jgi:hypothetical protein